MRGLACTSTGRGALCEVRRLSGNYDARPLSVSLLSDVSCSRQRATASIIGRKSLHRDLASRLLAPYGRVRCILSEPPNKQALRFAQDSDLRSGRDRSCPLSIRLETGTKMRSPMRHPAPSGKSARYTSHGVCSSTREHWHIPYSSRTPRSLAYTQHPNRAFTHIAIAFTRHPTVAALTPHTHHNPTHTTQTHITYTRANPRSSNGLRRRAIALRHSRRLCAATGTVPTPFLGGKTVTSTARAEM